MNYKKQIILLYVSEFFCMTLLFLVAINVGKVYLNNSYTPACVVLGAYLGAWIGRVIANITRGN